MPHHVSAPISALLSYIARTSLLLHIKQQADEFASGLRFAEDLDIPDATAKWRRH